MRSGRLPVVLSTTALVVAVLGATPLGHAAGKIPAFARKAAFATLAGNAQKLNGYKASATGKAGTIPVLNAQGKLPPSVGAVGPSGPAGATGPQGLVGSDGAPGTARAYALYDTIQNKLVHAHNVASVAQGGYGNGDWCVTLDKSIDASSVVVQAQVEFNTGGVGTAEWSNETGGCSTHPNSVQVWTLGPTGGAAPRSFTVIVP